MITQRLAEAAKSTHNYFIHINEKAAEEVEMLKRIGRCGKLCGVLLVVKDNIEVAGMPITNGAPYMQRMAEKTAPVVSTFLAEGAVVLGKTNMHELGLGVTNVNPHFGPTRNPHDPDYITGGSSGGSAGAVAAGFADLGIGTDTGGSVRIPAALCGVVGYKPPRDKISMEGIMPLAPTLDHVGFITKTVKDMINILTAVRLIHRVEPPKKFRFAILMGLAENSRHVEKAFWKAVNVLEAIGGSRDDLFLNGYRYSAARSAILLSEAAAEYYHLLRGVGDLMGRDVATLLTTGVALPAVAYITAQKVRRELTDFFGVVFKKYDVVVSPTTAIEAVPIEEVDHLAVRQQLLAYTELFNLTGHPAISIPAPTSGLPVGLQIAARDEEMLMAVAKAYEDEL